MSNASTAGRAPISTERLRIGLIVCAIGLAAGAILVVVSVARQRGLMLPTGPQPRLPQVDMVFTTGAGPVRIHAELAFTAEQKTAGLMFRRQLGADEGMLFTWAEPAPRCFWMRNTLIPLSAAFVDERGHVINIEEMSPLTDSRHCSTRPARFVLEAPQGWFSAHGVGPGDTLQIRPGP